MLRNLERLFLTLVSCLFFTTTGHAETEINFWAVSGSMEEPALFRKIGKIFEDRTGIKVRVTPLTWGDFSTKYFTSMAGGVPPDIGIANLGAPTSFGSVGGLIDLREEFPDEIQELEDRFYPSIMPGFTYKNKLFGLPTDLTTVVMYYRTDIFKKLGISPPKTWSELDRVISVLEANNMRYFYGWTRGEHWARTYHTLPYGVYGFRKRMVEKPGAGTDGSLSQASGAVVMEEEIIIDWNDPNYQKGIMNALKLWHLHDHPGNDAPDRTIARFMSDKPGEAMPLMIDGAWQDAKFHAAAKGRADIYDIAPWPRADDGVANNIVGGTSYVLFRESKYKREAFEFLKFITSLEIQQMLVLERMKWPDPHTSFTISPSRQMWEDSNNEYWQHPAFKDSQKMIRSISQIMDTLSTVESVHGTAEAERQESRILDRMGTLMIDRLTQLGNKHGLTRWEYIQEWAKGNHQDEKAELQVELNSTLKREYAAAAPRALAVVTEETNRYQEFYGNIIEDLKTYQDKHNVLDFLKIVALLFIIGLVVWILAKKEYRKHWVSYLFIASPIVLAIVFTAIPMLTAFYLSFTEYHPILPLAAAQGIGIKHYISMFASGDMPSSIWKTFIFVVITLPVGIIISLVFAALLNNKIYAQRMWRFLYFSPLLCGAVAVALIFTQLYRESDLGWINAFFLKIGLIHNPMLLLKGERSFLYCVIGLMIWAGLAFNILIFLAGLQQVPAQLYKAAEVDGAGWLRKFWHVSLPGIRPQIVLISVLGVIGGFQVFDTIFMLGGGTGYSGSKFGPNEAGMTIVPYLYSAAFENFNMGLASAIAYVLFAIIVTFTIIQFKIVGSSDPAIKKKKAVS